MICATGYALHVQSPLPLVLGDGINPTSGSRVFIQSLRRFRRLVRQSLSPLTAAGEIAHVGCSPSLHNVSQSWVTRPSDRSPGCHITGFPLLFYDLSRVNHRFRHIQNAYFRGTSSGSGLCHGVGLSLFQARGINGLD